MYCQNSSDFTFSANGSQLLSESPLLPSSHTGHGGDDLSLSELSIRDRGSPFTLLARWPLDGTLTSTHGDDDDDILLGEDEEHGEEEGDIDGEELQAEDIEKNKRATAKRREEKLQSDIFILKKINSSFAIFNEALNDTESANERVAAQLEQTEALLNKYVKILSKSEEFSRLIFDERWQGAEADEEALQRERLEIEEKTRREADERALAAQREQERRAREEQERVLREEKERIERERKERRGAVRGVRGTRASMRGVRGAGRGVPVATGRVGSSTTGTTNGSSSIRARVSR